MVIALMIGNAAGTKTLEHTQTGVGESGRADEAIAAAAPEHAQEMVLIQSTGATAADPGFPGGGRRAAQPRGASTHPELREPAGPGKRGPDLSDGHSALLRFEIAGNDTEVMDRVKPAVQAVDAVQKAHPGFTVASLETPAPRSRSTKSSRTTSARP